MRPQQWQYKINCSKASTPQLSAPILQRISLLSSTRSSHQRSCNNAKIFKINITSMWFDKGHVSTSVNQQASHAMVTNSCSKRSYKSKGENTTIPYTCIQTQCSNTVITASSIRSTHPTYENIYRLSQKTPRTGIRVEIRVCALHGKN